MIRRRCQRAGDFLVLLPVIVWAAEASSQAVDPLTPSDTSSPRATFRSFLDASDELYAVVATAGGKGVEGPGFLAAADRIRDCLDLSELPKELRDSAGLEAGVFLKEVLDRVALPAEADIPGDSEPGVAGDVWRVPGTRMRIAAASGPPYVGEYRFTPETVRRAAAFYQAARQLPYRGEGREVCRDFHDRFVAATRRQPQLTRDTTSPRGTLILFLDSMNEIDELLRTRKRLRRTASAYEPVVRQALGCLDDSDLPEYSREFHAAEAAVCLKEILDRTELPPLEEVPGAEAVVVNEGTDGIVQWQVPHTELVIARVQEGPRRGAFLFSAKSVQQAPEIYGRIRSRPYRTGGIDRSEGLHEWWLSTPGNPSIAALVDRLPDRFRKRLSGMALWQWVGLCVLVPAALVAMYVALRIGRLRGVEFRERDLPRYWASLCFPLVAMLVPLGVKYAAFEYLTIRGYPLYVLVFAADLVFLLALMLVIAGGCNRVAETIVALPSVRARGLDRQLIRIVGRLAGVVAAVVVFLEGGRYLGFPVTTLLASAGIGGLAIALAGQSLLKGLFGTLTLMLDKPFREGERIVVKGHDGIVEEIGLRSTKIRTFLTNHLVAIPNDQMADSEIENIGRRGHIRRVSDIHIPLDTPRAKVQQAVQAIRSVLQDHEGMDPAHPPRVYFTDFQADAFNIRIMYWYRPANLWDFYACSERINLEIFRLFEQHGIAFSLPLRHSYWKHDAGQGPLDVRVALTNQSQAAEMNGPSRQSLPTDAQSTPG
jgi:MscS family membrane protein